MSSDVSFPRDNERRGGDVAATLRDALPIDAPNRWVDPACDYCKPGAPCLLHDKRPRTLAQNRVIFGPSFGYEPTEDDRKEAAFPWDR